LSIGAQPPRLGGQSPRAKGCGSRRELGLLALRRLTRDGANRSGFALFGRGEAFVLADEQGFLVVGAGGAAVEGLVACVAEVGDGLVAGELAGRRGALGFAAAKIKRREAAAFARQDLCLVDGAGFGVFLLARLAGFRDGLIAVGLLAEHFAAAWTTAPNA